MTVIDTTGSSGQQRALPQQTLQAAYNLTAQVVFPLTLPFDLYFSRTTAYIGALGTSRAAMLAIVAGNSPSAAAAISIAAANLGINSELLQVIDGTDRHQAWDRWGLPQKPAQVIDPGTRAPYSPNPTDWVAAVSKVPVLLNRAGLTLKQLYQLLECTWVTQSSVSLLAGTVPSTTAGALPVVSPDTDLMSFTGLSADVLDRANRFLRLWKACGLQMWELDWALEATTGGMLNDSFLVFLSAAIAVQTKLNLPFQELLSFWMPLETRDVVNHLGDEDILVPSTYAEVFRNPVVLLTWSAIFVPLTQNIITGVSPLNESPIAITTALPHGYQNGMSVLISGVLGNTAANGTYPIIVTSSTSFTLTGTTGNNDWTGGGTATGTLSNNPIFPAGSTGPIAEQNAITAALGLSASDISAILAFTGLANLTSVTLNTLLRYQRLSSALSIDIPSLILWIQLTAGNPFNAQPADTLEFLRRLSVLQSTGIAIHDLDYLLRGGSAGQSSMTFTAAQATAVLQNVAAALGQLPNPIVQQITGVSSSSPVLINTSSPTGLPSGATVLISGVTGNAGANGSYVVTVTSSTSFTLNNSHLKAVLGPAEVSSRTPCTIPWRSR